MNKQRTQISPGQKLDLVLTETERQHILDDLTFLDADLEAIVRKTASGQPIQMTLDDLDQLAVCVAADANHTKSKKLEKALDRIFGKITALLDKYTDEPPKTLKIEDARKDKMIADQAVFIAEWTAQVLVAAGQMKLKTKVVDTFVPGKLERVVLSTLPTVSAKVRTKMSKGGTDFTVAEVCGMTMAVAEDLPAATPQEQMGLIMVAKTLMDSLQSWIAREGEAKLRKKPSKTKSVYQFKITLLNSKPPIWRRIQVQDCTLDDLHEHIQTAMGWMNSHLHHFTIGRKLYGDLELLEDMGVEIEDSTTTRLSEILPSDGKRFQFTYEYDFGDYWQHEVLFEGSPEPKKGTKLPLCLEGERACPPEDVGGLRGYADFLEAVSDPKHEEHKHMVEWIGRNFDPQKFDPVQASKAMKKGLPDWRDEEDDDF